MNVVELKTRSVDGAIAVLDDLRKRVQAGEIVAFCAVGIEADDTAATWCSTTVPVSRLRMMGAIASLQHCFHEGIE